MALHYDALRRDDTTFDQLIDADCGVKIMVSRQGAELVSLARQGPRGNWRGFLHRNADISKPESGWGNHATVMGYYLHRLVDGCSTYRDTPITGGTHGLIRTKEFMPPEVGDNSLTYRLSTEDFSATEYPLQVEFALTYTLLDGKLEVGFSFANHEPETTAHVSFGLHPGFATASIEQSKVILPPGIYTRHMAPGNFLSGETEVIDFPGGDMPFPKSELEGSFLLELTEVEDRLFYFEDLVHQRKVELDFSQVPYVTIWSDGGPFICVEPCWGMPDHAKQRKFEDKLGMQTIPAGQTLQRSVWIRPGFIY